MMVMMMMMMLFLWVVIFLSGFHVRCYLTKTFEATCFKSFI